MSVFEGLQLHCLWRTFAMGQCLDGKCLLVFMPSQLNGLWEMHPWVGSFCSLAKQIQGRRCPKPSHGWVCFSIFVGHQDTTFKQQANKQTNKQTVKKGGKQALKYRKQPVRAGTPAKQATKHAKHVNPASKKIPINQESHNYP